LISNKTAADKIKHLLIAAVICLLIGYGLDWLGITPIIKRIATSSFALASAGWVLLILSFLYWLVDVKQWNKHAWILVVIGMNAIFIYLFFETAGVQWVNGTVAIFVKGFLGFTGMSEKIMAVFSSAATLFLEWGLCYFLYKRKIFFKL
jgi:predicted acyltransferase